MKNYFRKQAKMLLLLIGLLSWICMDAYAQRIIYSYGRTGNRGSRKKEIVMQPSPSSASVTGELVLEEMLSERKITIYPNPTRGILRVDISGEPLPVHAHISLYNLSGSLVREWKELSGTNTLDISACPAGNYMLRIVTDKDHSTRWKIIKK